MNTVYEYLDYRQYLREFYEEKKQKNPRYSFRLFSDQSGFRSKSFIQHVIDGKKNLSESSVEKLNTVLKLNGKQLDYFRALVLFNQAPTRELRNLYWEQMCGSNSRNPLRLLMSRNYEFFSKWYHKTIREIICLVDFHEDYELLGRLVRPQIGAQDARESVELLLKLGLVIKTKTGFQLTDPLLTTGDEVRSLAVQNFHQENLQLAREAMDSVHRSERDISSLVVALSAEGFRRYKEEIQRFRKKLLDIAHNDQNQNSVYHVNFQLFPTSNPLVSED